MNSNIKYNFYYFEFYLSYKFIQKKFFIVLYNIINENKIKKFSINLLHKKILILLFAKYVNYLQDYNFISLY